MQEVPFDGSMAQKKRKVLTMGRTRNIILLSAACMFLILAGCTRKTDQIITEEVILGKSEEEAEQDQYPNRDITVIVAYKAGGGTDIGARALCTVAQKYLPVNLIVKNFSGADGELGYAQLCNASPDGYTIGFINLPTFVSLPLDRQTLYDDKGITPIINQVYDPSVLVVKSNSEISTLDDFIEHAVNHPFSITVGNNGYRASNHIAAASFCQKAKINVSHIPFGGSTDMLAALRDGYVEAAVAKISEVASYARDGKFKLLCSFTEERLEAFPDVPTLKEKGIDLVFGSARALVAPKDTSQSVIDCLVQAFSKAMEDPQMIQLSETLDLPLMYMGPEELSTYIQKQKQYVAEVVPRLPL